MFKKAQFWYADFLLAVLILAGISLLFISNITNLNSKQDKIQSLSSDSILISNSFVSEGYCPENDCENDWENNDGRIGFVKEGRIVHFQLTDLISLTSTALGYQTSKNLLGTRNNYIFYLEDDDSENTKIAVDGIASGKTVYGNPDVSEISQINATSFVRTTRFVYFNNNDLTKKIVKLIIIVW